ncbi:MAG: DUF507 domain-containing protein [Nitrospira bacterium HGW-Nitrospira-1]|nr:MAG: DUF507 domain-containing protein [Nitrospira bacterium HGW-Nitrospira-1]
MRIPKSWVHIIAKKIIDNLIARELVSPKIPLNKLLDMAEGLMIEDLMVEDRLNDEVRTLLKKHESEIERSRMDYRALFELTKKKLIKERNLVL